MKRSLACILAILWTLAAPPAHAQGFAYPDFSNVANLALNGAASQFGTVLQLTPATNTLAASVWHMVPQPLTGGFDTVFTFRITPFGSPADGMTFAIHNDPAGTAALGGTGSSLGYQSLTSLANSVIIELDTYWNAELGESAANYVSVHTNGQAPTNTHEAFSIGSIAAPVTLASGQAYTARIEYVPGTLNVYLNDLVNPLLSVAYDLTAGGTYVSSGAPVAAPMLAGGFGYVGFTAATGGLNEIHAVESWVFSSSPVAQPLALTFAQPLGPGSASIQVANGTPGAPYLTALSVDAANATSPGQGWWGGLHISILDLVSQVLIGAPPFAGVLDGSGGAIFTVPGGLPGGLPPVHGVSRTFTPALNMVTATSNVASITLL